MKFGELILSGAVVLAVFGAVPGLAQGPDPRMTLHALGDPKAPVTVDEYASLACPHCAEFAKDYWPKLKADYIDKGKVKLVFHDLPIWPIGVKAAQLSRCVPEERYFPIVETLFQMQSAWAHQPSEQAVTEALKQQGKFAGLSGEQIDKCLNDRGLEDGILQEEVDAGKPPLGVEGTPTFFVNGDPASKVARPDYEALKAEIDKKLRK